MMASKLNQCLENVDEKVLECTICFKRLQNPKSLTCLHSFCLACLEDRVKMMGKLTCPICSKSYAIPEGGLRNLSTNDFIKKLIETMEQLSVKDQIKCICANGEVKYYCQECRQYLCSTCSDQHKILPVLENMQLPSLPAKCSVHSEALKFFCCICNIPICIDCTITDHKELEGNHKPISISKAFKTFKETSAELEESANDCKNKLHVGLKAVKQSALTLDQSKETTLRDIDNHVQEMFDIIKENGEKIKTKVETIYKKKKKVLDVQMDDLETKISDIITKQSYINQLLKSDEVTAMQSSDSVVTALKDRINDMPKGQPDNDRYIKFHINENQMSLLQQHDIGYVSHMKAANCLTLKGGESVTQGQTIVVKIIKTNKCKIYTNQLKATWTHPTGEIHVNEVQEDDNGGYFVTGKCTSPGICRLDVIADGEVIKQSPMVIKVEKTGFLNSMLINVDKSLSHVVKYKNNCLLVSSFTNEVLEYGQSGKYIGKVTLPQGVVVDRMYNMKNGNIVFIDGIECVRVCSMTGEIIKSIGQGLFKDPSGIHVDEPSNTVYVGDKFRRCVFIFDINSGELKKSIGSKNDKDQINGVIDVSLTNQGQLLVLEYGNSRLQLFDNEGKFMGVLVDAGDENEKLRYPGGVVVDEDGNIIISSKNKLQLFSSDGNFVKRIDNEKDGINRPYGLSIISYHPRRVAVVNNGDTTIKIFNY